MYQLFRGSDKIALDGLKDRKGSLARQWYKMMYENKPIGAYGWENF